jgi:hypothetical protein
MVTNGTFASNTTGWAGVSGTIAIASSQLQLTGGGSSTVVAYAQQTFATTVGKAYTVSVDFISVSGGTNRYIYIGTSTSGANRFNVSNLSNANVVVGTNTFTFTAQSTSTLLSLGTYEAQVALWDNVTVRLAEKDRSFRDQGVQVFGTVNKTAVATGADLVGYSNFSASNYLRQPYNTYLNFGTGDFTYHGWINWNNGTGYLFDRADSTGNGRVSIYINSGAGVITWYTENGNISSNGGAFGSGSSSQDHAVKDKWMHLAIVRRNGKIYGYKNGHVTGSFSDTGGKSNAGSTLTIGARYNLQNPLVGGSVALIRASADAATPAQLQKIYHEEKELFLPNSKATLYNSDDCEAVAYDRGTGLVHVGTSDGKHAFKGCRRVSYTSGTIGHKLSASNGLIAEE